MRGSVRGAMGTEEQGDGAGVSVGVLQQMGGHNPAGFGTVDSGLLGGNLQLPEGTRGMVGRLDKLTNGKFYTSINPMDGYTMANCIDLRERTILEFIVPILYPKKLRRVILTVGNTNFGALSGFRKVN